MMKSKVKRVGLVVLAVLVGGLALIQLVPYGRDHSNPPVTSEPKWDTPQTKELAQRACFDCHSNETVWPWYSNVAPVSWLVQNDADEGRRVLNFSTWDNGGRGREAGEAIEAVQEGFMPPPQYLVTHPKARLTTAEKQALVQGLRATIFQQ
ncbi:MAG: heme-binding domain-containing protein [Chloroflexota bacterium]|jgi:mono/diheme cytochrome c family protein